MAHKVTIGNSSQILHAINQADNIIIFHHIRPDGDCLGSQAALAELIRINYPQKQVFIIGNNYKQFPYLNWKYDENEDLIKQTHGTFLAIVVDTSSLDRIENSELFNSSFIQYRARIDHHEVSENALYNYSWVNPEAAAAAEMVIELAKKHNLKISYEFLEKSYLGLMTDSVRYLYSNQRHQTLELGAWVISQGFNPKDLYRNLYKKTMKDLSYQAHVLSNFTQEGKVLYFIVRREESSEFGFMQNEAAMFVNLLANIEDNRIWLFVVENEDHTFRLRIRSNGPSLIALAQEYNGGGHALASGASIPSLSELPLFLKKCNDLIRSFHKQNNLKLKRNLN